MEQEEVRSFFDGKAGRWAAAAKNDSAAVEQILACARLQPGAAVLDVACGTGRMIPEYLARGAGLVTGIDLSGEMIRFARENCRDARVEFRCADMETVSLPRQYDLCMIYNAFPHFVHPERLLANVRKVLKPGGRLMVAHDMGRAELNRFHMQHAKSVSQPLPTADAMEKLFGAGFAVDVKISAAHLYIVSGYLQ